MLPVHLERRQAEDVIGGAAVAGHALRPAGIVPGLLADTVWMFRGSGFTNCKIAVCALRADQRGLRLVVVPEVRVADPLAGLFNQQAGLNPSA